MKPFVSPREASVLKVVIWFANLDRVKSTSQIETRFAKAVGMGFDEFQEINPGEESKFEGDRSDLRDWLRLVASGNDAAGERKLIEEVDDFLRRKLHVRLLGPANAPRLEMRPDGVEATCALGLALLLDSSRGLRSRLGYCAWEGCGRFSLNLAPKGRPKHFCNDNHRLKAWRSEHRTTHSQEE